MEWTPLLYAGIYLAIGWFLSDWLEKDNDVMAMVVFMAWPAVIVILVMYVIVGLAFAIRDMFTDIFDEDDA